MDDGHSINHEPQPFTGQAFKAYKRRWFILTAVCVVNCSNAMVGNNNCPGSFAFLPPPPAARVWDFYFILLYFLFACFPISRTDRPPGSFLFISFANAYLVHLTKTIFPRRVLTPRRYYASQTRRLDDTSPPQ